jgi:hypothetical protein
VERKLLRDESVSYFITPTQVHSYDPASATGRKKVRQLEQQVEQTYVHYLDQACQRQRQERVVAVRRARWVHDSGELEKAQAMPTPSCDRLASFLNRVQS